jgi:hypothetical protein
MPSTAKIHRVFDQLLLFVLHASRGFYADRYGLLYSKTIPNQVYQTMIPNAKATLLIEGPKKRANNIRHAVHQEKIMQWLG